MTQPQVGHSIREPLAPAALYRAGVPMSDVLWFNSLSMPAQMRALRTPRGESILAHVRQNTGKARQAANNHNFSIAC